MAKAYDAETDSLSDLVYSAVLMCDVDVRKELLANIGITHLLFPSFVFKIGIVIVGGGSLIDGVAQRLTHELTELVPSTMKVSIVYIYAVVCIHGGLPKLKNYVYFYFVH